MSKSKMNTFLSAIRPEEYMFIFFALLLATLLIYYRLGMTFSRSTVLRMLIPFLIILLVGMIKNFKKLQSKDKLVRRSYFKGMLTVTRDWSPFILLILVYENLHDLVKVIRPDVADHALRWMDRMMFGGVEPVLWMERLINPWFTDYMVLSYNLYIFPAIILALILYFKKWHGDFRDLMMALIISFYLGFLGYMLVPAIGPRYILEDEYTVKLEGVFLYNTSKDIWNNLEFINRDCFPSLHTAQSAIALFFAFKFAKKSKLFKVLAWVFLPLVVSLWFSTVYLRYHWVIDVIAGLVLAVFVFLIAPLINRAWEKRVAPLPKNEDGIPPGDDESK